jgi:hypothetical protein
MLRIGLLSKMALAILRILEIGGEACLAYLGILAAARLPIPPVVPARLYLSRGWPSAIT